jgi:hypothetical protein
VRVGGLCGGHKVTRDTTDTRKDRREPRAKMGGLCGVGGSYASGRVDKTQGKDTRGASARWTIDRWTGGQVDKWTGGTVEEWNQLQKSQTERGGRRTSDVGSSTWRANRPVAARVWRRHFVPQRGCEEGETSCAHARTGRAVQPCHFDSRRHTWACLSCGEAGL